MPTAKVTALRGQPCVVPWLVWNVCQVPAESRHVEVWVRVSQVRQIGYKVGVWECVASRMCCRGSELKALARSKCEMVVSGWLW